VGAIDQKINAQELVAIGFDRILGGSSCISKSAGTEEEGLIHGLAGGASAGVERQSVILKHGAAKIGALLQSLSRKAAVDLRGIGSGNNQVQLHQRVIDGRVHHHAGQLVASVTKLGDAIHHQALRKLGGGAADRVAAGQGAAGAEDTVQDAPGHNLHVPDPVTTSAPGDSLGGIGTGQVSGEIAGLPGLAAHVANANLHITRDFRRNGSHGVGVDLRIAGQVAIEGQVNGLAAFGEFGLNCGIRDHQARSDQRVLVADLFLLIVKKQLGNKGNACEKHRLVAEERKIYGSAVVESASQHRCTAARHRLSRQA